MSRGRSSKASQISRFLLRTYKQAGNTCEAAASEIEEAAACLYALKVVPSEAEATSAKPVIRAQMAVYVVGLGHNPLRPRFAALTA